MRFKTCLASNFLNLSCAQKGYIYSGVFGNGLEHAFAVEKHFVHYSISHFNKISISYYISNSVSHTHVYTI